MNIPPLAAEQGMRPNPAPRGHAALLVPCYNAAKYLPRLRKQVDRLSPAFDEVLLADDASTDETQALAADQGFKIITLPSNRGPGGARNALARAVATEWIHFHDVDDEISPAYLNRVLPAAGNDCDAVIHFTDFIDEQTRSLIIRWDFQPVDFARHPALTLLTSPMPTMSSFLRRETFLRFGGFNERFRCFEDGDLHFRLAANGARMSVVPEVLEWSLRHDGGAGANQHYCAKCRLEFLREYSRSQPPNLHAAIAAEAERTAVKLLRYGDTVNAHAAITLCRELGRPIAMTQNLVAKMLRAILPVTAFLRLQDRWRHLH